MVKSIKKKKTSKVLKKLAKYYEFKKKLTTDWVHQKIKNNWVHNPLTKQFKHFNRPPKQESYH